VTVSRGRHTSERDEPQNRRISCLELKRIRISVRKSCIYAISMRGQTEMKSHFSTCVSWRLGVIIAYKNRLLLLFHGKITVTCGNVYPSGSLLTPNLQMYMFFQTDILIFLNLIAIVTLYYCHAHSRVLFFHLLPLLVRSYLQLY